MPIGGQVGGSSGWASEAKMRWCRAGSGSGWAEGGEGSRVSAPLAIGVLLSARRMGVEVLGCVGWGGSAALGVACWMGGEWAMSFRHCDMARVGVCLYRDTVGGAGEGGKYSPAQCALIHRLPTCAATSNLLLESQPSMITSHRGHWCALLITILW